MRKIFVLLLALLPLSVVAQTIESLRPVFGKTDDGRIVVREVVYVDGSRKHLVFDPVDLSSSLEAVRFREVKSLSDVKDNSLYFRLLEKAGSDTSVYPKGIGSFDEVSGYVLSADLCQSSKPIDSSFVRYISGEGLSPFYVCVAGKWIDKHKGDLEWLKGQPLSIVWVNHSLTHPYRRKEPMTDDFLLNKGVDWYAEIVGNERVMIENGLVPSPFFRYPGLIANQKLQAYLLSLGIIPLGSDAWVAHHEKIESGRVVLLHINGNEREGLEMFERDTDRLTLKPESIK